MLMDSHAHYDHIKFDKDREEVLEAIKAAGIDLVINPAITMESNETMREKLHAYPWIYYAVGLHPKHVGEYDSQRNYVWRSYLKEAVNRQKVIAVGETGLDYSVKISAAQKMQQKLWFRNLLEIAQDNRLPAILHIRDAHEDAMEILSEYPLKQSGVVHCFDGGVEEARRYVEEFGLFLGIGGKVTHPDKEELRKAVVSVPLDRILLETDSPFLKPEGSEGKRNTSLNLSLIVKTIAQLKGISQEEVIRATTENVKKLFHVSPPGETNVYLTGDTHGGFKRIGVFCERMQTAKEDILIILGDAGINYYGLHRDAYKKEYISKLPITLFCIHGNHEQRPYTIFTYQEQTWHGGTVYVDPEYPNIIFAKDGEIYDFDGQKAIVIGGAYSVDKKWRIVRARGGTPEWWPDEQPSDETKNYVEQQLEKCNWTVDIVLSHTVPLQYEPKEVFLPGIDQSNVDKSTEIWLERIEKRLTYKAWYAGHYHTEKKVDNLQLMFEDYEMLLPE